MNLEQKITKLTAIWYNIVNTDHHKDKDCHFYINKTWSYGQKPVYTVEHYGYIREDINEEFETYAEAEKFLHDILVESINTEKLWAEEVLETENDKNNEYSNIGRARKILKIIEENNLTGDSLL